MSTTTSPYGLPRTFLRPCILLLLSDGPSHGYDLLNDIRAVGLHGVEAGGLYRSLRAMDEDRLVRSWWEASESGPDRRVYALTRRGRAAMAEHMEELAAIAQLLDDLLARYRVASNPSPPLP